MTALLPETLVIWVLLICIVIIIWYRNLGPDRYLSPLLLGDAFLALLIYAYVNGLPLSLTYRLIFGVIGLQIVGIGVGLGLYLHSLSWVLVAVIISGVILFWFLSKTTVQIIEVTPAMIVIIVGMINLITGMLFNFLCIPEGGLTNQDPVHYKINRLGIFILLVVGVISVISLILSPCLKTCSYLIVVMAIGIFLTAAGYQTW